MSAPTLTDPILTQLVGFLELAEEPGEREEFMGRIYAILPRYEAALALAEACEDLVRQINRVHESQAYHAVWALAQLHRGPYAGPQYGDELAVAEAALAAYREARS